MTGDINSLDGSVKAQAFNFLVKLAQDDSLPGLHIEPINELEGPPSTNGARHPVLPSRPVQAAGSRRGRVTTSSRACGRTTTRSPRQRESRCHATRSTASPRSSVATDEEVADAEMTSVAAAPEVPADHDQDQPACVRRTWDLPVDVWSTTSASTTSSPIWPWKPPRRRDPRAERAGRPLAGCGAHRLAGRQIRRRCS